MQMLLLSFLGSALAYFAFMSAASSAASAQSAAQATAWPPSPSDQAALASQISGLVAEVSSHPLSALEQAHLKAQLDAAPAEYVATLPQGATPTLAGYQAWILAGAAGNLHASTLGTSGNVAPGASGAFFPPAGYSGG